MNRMKWLCIVGLLAGALCLSWLLSAETLSPTQTQVKETPAINPCNDCMHKCTPYYASDKPDIAWEKCRNKCEAKKKCPARPPEPTVPTCASALCSNIMTTRTLSKELAPLKCCTGPIVKCNNDEIVVGGGFLTGDDPQLVIFENYPKNNSWYVTATNYSNVKRAVTGYAICMKKQ